MGVFRARISGFLAGFATASAASLYLLQRDVWASYKVLSEQAEGQNATLDARLSRLEQVTAVLATEAATKSAE